jgi:hypothetical protein
VVEHLEAGLRPEPGLGLGERLDELEAEVRGSSAADPADVPRTGLDDDG